MSQPHRRSRDRAVGGASDLEADLLHGARAIALFIYDRDDNATRRKIYHNAERRKKKGTGAPIFRNGVILTARKSELADYYSAKRQTSDMNQFRRQEDATSPSA